jgi:hypothetical protein
VKSAFKSNEQDSISKFPTSTGTIKNYRNLASIVTNVKKKKKFYCLCCVKRLQLFLNNMIDFLNEKKI